MISLLKSPSVQRNVKKCLENESFEKLIVLPSSGSTMNMYACAEELIWKVLHDCKIPEYSKCVIKRPSKPRKAAFKFSCETLRVLNNPAKPLRVN